MATEKLTEYESKVVKSLVENLDADEPTFSNIYVEDLEEMTNIPTTKLRGVVSSLIKKGYVYTMSLGADMNIIYLEEKYFKSLTN